MKKVLFALNESLRWVIGLSVMLIVLAVCLVVAAADAIEQRCENRHKRSRQKPS